MQHINMIVHGFVQGVGFRYFTQKTASLYGICGWVRNRADGSVEIKAEGGAAAVSAFIEAIKSGSRFPASIQLTSKYKTNLQITELLR